MRATDQAAGALLLLPPYPPYFNSIETTIYKVKAVLRKLAKRAVPELFDAIDAALAAVTAADARAFIAHCGYATERCKPL